MIDNQPAKNIIEKIKSVILVVLLLLTILLLYFFWKDIEIREFSLSGILSSDDSMLADVIAPEEIIVPSHIDICFDEQTYTKIISGREFYWDNDNDSCIKTSFEKVVSSIDTFTEEISEEQYEEIMEFVSARAMFDYYVPFVDYCKLLGLSNPSSTDVILSISEIGFSAGSYDSMFIYDGVADKYYRIVSEFSSEELLARITELASSENMTYYPLESYVGTSLEKRVLIPSYLESNLQTATVKKDFTAQDHDVISDIARTFFSGNFDFVRKIEEERGKVIYMYGYGQKTLIADIDGTIEYKTETMQQPGLVQIGYFDALEEALAMAALQGGFKTSYGKELSPYLTYAGSIGNSGNDYRFEFGVKAEDENLYYEEGNAVEIEIVNGQVSYFRRNFIAAERTEMYAENTEAYTPINVLAQNYEYLYDLVKGTVDVPAEDGSEILDEFNVVASQIDDMRNGYVFMKKSSTIVPCHIVTMAEYNLEVYFDIYTAQPLGYSRNDLRRGKNGL